MQCLTIVGARPQFIKAAAVSRIMQNTEGITEVRVHTGQHYDANMSDIFFQELDIPPPDYKLNIRSGTHGMQTGKMLMAIEEVLLREKPDWVMVYGDTNSTLAGALAAVKLHVPVAHVEAGLRSFNRIMPEEINRVLTDHIADLLFAPTEIAVKNLCNEGLSIDKISLVGDVMYDVAMHYGLKAEERSHIIQSLNIKPKNYILATVHRAENTDNIERLWAIFKGLDEVSKVVPVILPLHPRTKAALLKEGIRYLIDGIRVIDPVSYLDMIMLERNASLIATDSGGVQKEAFFYRVPCVTLRDETEWMELVELGWNRVITPNDSEEIAATILSGRGRLGVEANPYGEGRTAENIVQRFLCTKGFL